jgi:hypothetical protein
MNGIFLSIYDRVVVEDADVVRVLMDHGSLLTVVSDTDYVALFNQFDVVTVVRDLCVTESPKEAFVFCLKVVGIMLDGFAMFRRFEGFVKGVGEAVVGILMTLVECVQFSRVVVYVEDMHATSLADLFDAFLLGTLAKMVAEFPDLVCWIPVDYLSSDASRRSLFEVLKVYSNLASIKLLSKLALWCAYVY